MEALEDKNMVLSSDQLLRPDSIGRIAFGWRGTRADSAIAVLRVGLTCAGAFVVDLWTPRLRLQWLAPHELTALLDDLRCRLVSAGYDLVEDDGQSGDSEPVANESAMSSRAA
jgi:hypothetical protein